MNFVDCLQAIECVALSHPPPTHPSPCRHRFDQLPRAERHMLKFRSFFRVIDNLESKKKKKENASHLTAKRILTTRVSFE